MSPSEPSSTLWYITKELAERGISPSCWSWTKARARKQRYVQALVPDVVGKKMITIAIHELMKPEQICEVLNSYKELKKAHV